MQTAMKKAPAHFFKFIRPSPNSNLSVPISFHKYLKSTRRHKTAILRRGDQEWVVKIGGDWVFGEGWDDFMTENGVQDFDVVVFKHEGNMVFDIMVFDPSWCEREYSNDQVIKSSRKRKLVNKKALEMSKGRNTYINQSRKSLLKDDKSSKAIIPHLGKKHVVIVSRLSTNTSAIVTSTEIPVAALTNPYFRPTITANTIKSGRVNIPLAFARSNKLVIKDCELLVMDENQRVWQTRLRDSGGHVRIYRSRDMLVANGIKEGDVVLLELVDNGIKPLMNLYRDGCASLKLT